MPRVSPRGGVRFHIPGVYAALLRRECVTGARSRLGPLLYGGVGEPRPLAEREAVFEKRRRAGEPLDLPKRCIGGHTVRMPAGAPEWLRLPATSGGTRRVQVYADDTVEPMGDAMPRVSDGGGGARFHIAGSTRGC
jgi:hypothetical protein